MILTIFRPDGTVERRPLGYSGGLCEQATAPYERKEVPGVAVKTPTQEAFEEPVKALEPEKLYQ